MQVGRPAWPSRSLSAVCPAYNPSVPLSLSFFLFSSLFLPLFFPPIRLSNSPICCRPPPSDLITQIVESLFFFYIPFHSSFFFSFVLSTLEILRGTLLNNTSTVHCHCTLNHIPTILRTLCTSYPVLSQLSHSQLICRASSDQSLVRHHQEPPKNQKIKKSKKPTCTSGSCSRPDQLLSSYPILFSLSLFFFFFSPL